MLGLGLCLRGSIGPLLLGSPDLPVAIDLGLITLAILAGIGLTQHLRRIEVSSPLAGLLAAGLAAIGVLALPAMADGLTPLLLPLAFVAPLPTVADRRRPGALLVLVFLALPLGLLAGPIAAMLALVRLERGS